MEFKETVASMLIERFTQTPEWMSQAKCVDGEFDPMYNREKEAFIREKCNQCSVIQQCRSQFKDAESIEGVFYGEDH